jgi:uncharacterized protein YqjF (DUF2071 family)
MPGFDMESSTIDRVAGRAKPPGSPVMHQRWEDLLFLHWPIPADLIRPLVPAELELDLFENQSWISVTPLHLTDVRMSSMPAVPGTSDFHELNVRTYVLRQGVPGIWFFSLDASKLLPILGARILYGLPYYKARIRFARAFPDFGFSSSRTGSETARLSVTWKVGRRLRDPATSSLAFFLVERYSLFTVSGKAVYQTRIYHHPYILEEAIVTLKHSSMIDQLGIPEPVSEPVTHFSRSLEVDVWPPVEL